MSDDQSSSKFTPQSDSTTHFERILPYLIEFRRRALYCIALIVVVSCVLFPLSNRLYTLLALPLLHYLPQGSKLIATGVMSPFWAPIKLTVVCAVLVSVPYLLYNLWAFIAPALYRRERRWAVGLLVASTLLFYAGVGFSYVVVFPLIFQFLMKTAPQSVSVMPDISLYLDFSLQLLLAFGVAFEVPVAVVLLLKTGLVTHHQLVRCRPYMIIAAFAIGMLVAPDVVSQIALAVPLWLLFEAGLLLGKWIF